jgi:hypothetical protein
MSANDFEFMADEVSCSVLLLVDARLQRANGYDGLLFLHFILLSLCVGPVGFCTGTCDGIQVIEYIKTRNAAHPLAKFYAGFKVANLSS